MPELSILDPIILPQVVTEFEAPENLRGLNNLVTIDNDDQPMWDYDIERASRGALLKHQVPNAEATIIDQMPIGHMQGGYAYKREKKRFSASTLRLLRRVGEGRASTAAGEARVVSELADHRMQLQRAEEVAIWKMMQGSWPYVMENGVTITISYGIPATHLPVLSGNDVWPTGSTVDARDDIATWKRIVEQDSGFPIDEAWMNNVTMTKFLGLTIVDENLSDRQKDVFTREFRVPRFQGVDWFEYHGGYVDDAGSFVNYIPDDKIIFIATGGSTNFVMKYGPSVDLDAPPDWTGPFTKSWLENDPSVRYVLMELQYMPIMLNPQKVLVATINS